MKLRQAVSGSGWRPGGGKGRVGWLRRDFSRNEEKRKKRKKTDLIDNKDGRMP